MKTIKEEIEAEVGYSLLTHIRQTIIFGMFIHTGVKPNMNQSMKAYIKKVRKKFKKTELQVLAETMVRYDE